MFRTTHIIYLWKNSWKYSNILYTTVGYFLKTISIIQTLIEGLRPSLYNSDNNLRSNAWYVTIIFKTERNYSQHWRATFLYRNKIEICARFPWSALYCFQLVSVRKTEQEKDEINNKITSTSRRFLKCLVYNRNVIRQLSTRLSYILKRS